MYIAVNSLEDFHNYFLQSPAAIFYFSHEKCNVCKVLKPKIKELITEYFPKISLYYCDTVNYPEIAAQYSIFAVPTLLACFDGKELFRKSRNIGIGELKFLIDRPYKLFFE